MKCTVDAKQLRRLDIQGFDTVDEVRLAEVAPWHRLAFQLCATLAIVGTVSASTTLLSVLAAVAFAAALSPVHPFDLIYNHGIRRTTGTPPLPKRGAPTRFACGIGSLMLLAMVGAFHSSADAIGYGLGVVLVSSAVLVGTTDICVPSMIYRALFGAPARRIAPSPEPVLDDDLRRSA